MREVLLRYHQQYHFPHRCSSRMQQQTHFKKKKDVNKIVQKHIKKENTGFWSVLIFRDLLYNVVLVLNLWHVQTLN